jgi:hypothetical protein
MHRTRSLSALFAVVTCAGCALADGSTTSNEPPTTTPAEDGPEPTLAPRSCNDSPLSAWSEPTKLDVHGAAGSTASEPYVLPDARTLLFAAKDASGKRRFESATRATVGGPFGPPVPLEIAGPGLDGQELDFPTAISAHEIVFGLKGELWVGTRDGSDGPFAARYYDDLALNTGIEGVGSGWPTLTADGRIMAFGRGPLFKWRLFEARRANAEPGAPWTQVAELAELNDPSGATMTFCPVFSADGRSIWFTVSSASGATVQVARRESTAPSAVFAGKTAVPVLSGGLTCPRAITADGCEMYLQSNRDGTDSLWVSHRAR